MMIFSSGVINIELKRCPKITKKALGSWIENSGRTSVLVQACVTYPGTADSFFKALHVSCTRHAHQVTAATMYVLGGQGIRRQ